MKILGYLIDFFRFLYRDSEFRAEIAQTLFIVLAVSYFFFMTIWTLFFMKEPEPKFRGPILELRQGEE